MVPGPRSNGNRQPMVGRVRERRILGDAMALVEAGGTAAVSLAGEPGIGKTRLLQEACDEARELGFRVLAGRATELENEIAYAMISEAFEDAVRSLSERKLLDLIPAELAELGRLFPFLGRSAAAATAAERWHFHRSVRSVLQLLAGHAPVLLALDDLHWTDHASLEVVAHLLRRAVPGCLLVLTHRTAQLPAGHAGVLGRAFQDGALSAVELGPLSLPETADLLGDVVRAYRLPDLHEECGGNPFYLQEMARARTNAAIPDPATSGHQVPALVQAALRLEIEAMSPPAQRLLHAAAVAGEPFDIDLALGIGALTSSETISAIDELVATRLVQGVESSAGLYFRHPLIRRAVYEQIGYGWRRAAHGRAATILAERGADPSIRAHHLEHSSAVGDEKAISALAEAGRSAARRAPLTAARWFRAALRLLPAGQSDARGLDLTIALADALTSVGRLRESREVLGRAVVDFAEQAPDADRARMLAMLAATEQGLGNPAEGRRLLNAALDLVDPGSVEAASYRLESAKSNMFCGDWEEAVNIATALMETARGHSDRRLSLLATAANAFIASTQLDTLRLRFGVECLEESARTLNTLTDSEIAPGLLNGYNDVMLAAVVFERWSMAVDHADRGIRLCRATGHDQHMADLLHLQAVAQLMRGYPEPALGIVEQAVETALLLDNPPLTAITEATRCWVLSLLGRTEEALAVGARAVRIAAEAPRDKYSHHPPLAYGAALIEAGEYARGRELIVTRGGYGNLGDVNPTTMSPWMRALVDAEVELGDIAAADRIARQMQVVADAAPMMAERVGDALYARARVELARGRAQRAEELIRESVLQYDRSDTAVYAARARLLLGEVLTERGETEAAASEFALALEVAIERHAAGTATRARAARARLDDTVSASDPHHLPAVSVFDRLTDRQREIVGRVARGMTNRQIAAELFVSEKTVEAHLSRLFAKLNVSSRTALAALAVADSVRRT
ncbi:helix-turn-helix transcriptional regulator [Nocardia flavorosea]|uniref:helix-turn-helix transcriptional regulator n=1 Tax=Nocardia flavorosea TaxID=53429 RepID=UPI002B4B1790|nr:AAA family ATPase [Nocardia flavorosea]